MTGLAEVSLGHSAFVGIGAYAATWCGGDRGGPIFVWLPAAGIAAAVVAGIVGPFAARLRGLYLAGGHARGRDRDGLRVAVVDEPVRWVQRPFDARRDGVRPRPVHQLRRQDRHAQLHAAVLVPVPRRARGRRAGGPQPAEDVARARLPRRARSRRRSVGHRASRRTDEHSLSWRRASAVASPACSSPRYESYITPAQFNLDLSIQYVAMVCDRWARLAVGRDLRRDRREGTAGPRPQHRHVPPVHLGGAGCSGFSADNLAPAALRARDHSSCSSPTLGVFGIWTCFKQVWRTWPWSRG